MLSRARRVVRALRGDASTPTRRLRLCKQLLSEVPGEERLADFHGDLQNLDVDAQHYWIGVLYTLLMDAAERRAHAAYFTPPEISKSLIKRVIGFGFDVRKHSVIDPAAGGAAFLSTIAGEMRAARSPGQNVAARLAGFDIDSGLARLSEALIGDRLGIDIDPSSIVSHRDSLSLRVSQQYDLVVANPPYGRVSADIVSGERWQKVCHAGHINRFALFTELCFRLAKPKGLVALVLPSSIVAGPLYDKLRMFVREHGELLLLGEVPDRDDVFVDVQQDISILVARAGGKHRTTKQVVFGKFPRGKSFRTLGAGALGDDLGAAWTMPDFEADLARGGATLADYGVRVRAGYFVWNRECGRMRCRPYTPCDVPLIWAENIVAGGFCTPISRDGRGIDFVNFKSTKNPSIVRGNAIVLQRTTNSSQPRRLIAGRVSPSVTREWGGFITENHTIVLTGPTPSELNLLLSLLNSKAVDRRYRRLSGTASVSVKLLRVLDLPKPAHLRAALAKNDDVEAAIDQAYASSASKKREVA